jgi:VanZ family protein
MLYGLLLVYTSLFPFCGWAVSGHPFGWLTGALPNHISRKDALVNLLAYIPLGFLVCHCFLSRDDWRTAVVRSLLLGFCLSFTMESFQNFLPVREPSLVDLVTNSSGTAIGAALAFLSTVTASPGGALYRYHENWLEPGCGSSIGAGVLLVWVMARLSPFVPALQRTAMHKSISPLWSALSGRTPLQPLDAMMHCCYATGLALLTVSIMRPATRPLRLFSAAAAVVLTLRIFIVNGNLTLEELVGYSAGVGLAVVLAGLPGDFPEIAAMAAFVAGFVLFEVRAGTVATLTAEINWIPFRCHLENTLAGIGQILDGIWPFSALALLWLKLKRTGRGVWMACGGFSLFLAVALLEWQQQFIPGRTADITQALLAFIGWCSPYYLWKICPEKSRA